MNWQHDKVTNLTLNLDGHGGVYKLQNSIFVECFSGVQLDHVQLLDFKGFLQHLTLTDTELFFCP